MDFNNNNSFNHNMNSYFTLTSFDLDNSDPAIYNMNQLYMPGWDYPTEHDSYPQSYDHNFSIISTLHRVNRDSPSPSQTSTTFPQFSFPDLDPYSPFPVSLTEEKFNLERTMKAMPESQQQIHNLLNSQSFPNQTPYTPFLEHPIEEESELEKRLEVFCEKLHRFQNMLDSSS